MRWLDLTYTWWHAPQACGQPGAAGGVHLRAEGRQHQAAGERGVLAVAEQLMWEVGWQPLLSRE